MNHSRRSFLRNSAMGLGAIAFASPAMQALAAVKYKKLVGVQLYSVRDEMKRDPQATLNALAEMGYKYVEHANYIDRKFYGWEAKEFKKRLDDLGMKMPSGHTVMGKKHWDEGKNEFRQDKKRNSQIFRVCNCLNKYGIINFSRVHRALRVFFC